MFAEGEWVKERSSRFAPNPTYRFGFIVEGGNGVNEKIYVPETEKEQWASKRLLEDYEDVLPEVKIAAKKIFVDMALMTNDKEWFMEVTR